MTSEQLVYTTKGLVPFRDLSVTDHFELHEGTRVHATEWRMNGELVRRDVEVNVLRGLEITSAQASVG